MWIAPGVLIALTLVSCSGRAAPPTSPSVTAAADGDAGVTAPPPDVGAGPVAAAPITDAECGQLVDHTLALGMADQRATKSPDDVPTPDQVDEIRAALLAAQPCAQLTRAQLTCAQAATTRAALYRCGE